MRPDSSGWADNLITRKHYFVDIPAVIDGEVVKIVLPAEFSAYFNKVCRKPWILTYLDYKKCTDLTSINGYPEPENGACPMFWSTVTKAFDTLTNNGGIQRVQIQRRRPLLMPEGYIPLVSRLQVPTASFRQCLYVPD